MAAHVSAVCCPHCGSRREQECFDAVPERRGLRAVKRTDYHLARYVVLGTLFGLMAKLHHDQELSRDERHDLYVKVDNIHPGNPFRPRNHSGFSCKPGAWGSAKHCASHGGAELCSAGTCPKSPGTIPGDTPYCEP